MTLPNLPASADPGGPCEIPAPVISQSDVVQRARQALDDLVTGLLAEVERLREGDWATLSRNLHNAETERDRLRATIERVREANGLVHAHRFDMDNVRSEHDAWLKSFGESRAGGPDAFYNGVEFAHRRINRALDGEA